MSNFELILYPPQSPVAFSVFNYPIRYYGIIIMFSMLIGYVLVYNFMKKNYTKNDSEIFVDYSAYLIVTALLGARLLYVAGSFDYYRINPQEIIMINHGGISIWGAILFGIAGLYVLSKIFKFSYIKHISVFALFIPLCQAIGRWGNFFNQEAFGLPSDFFLKLFVYVEHRPEIYQNNAYFHPAFLYESILDVFIFIILFATYNKNKPLNTFYLYLILYSFARIGVESVRLDSILNINSVPIAIIISVIVMISAIIGLILNAKINNKENE